MGMNQQGQSWGSGSPCLRQDCFRRTRRLCSRYTAYLLDGVHHPVLYALLHGHDALDVVMLVVTVDCAAEDQLEEPAQLSPVQVLAQRVHVRHVEVVDVLVQHLVNEGKGNLII